MELPLSWFPSKCTRHCTRPPEFSLLHTVGDQGHNATKILHKANVEGGKSKETRTLKIVAGVG